MKYQFKFKSIDHSLALCEYTKSKFEKLEIFEIKPLKINVTFSAYRHMKRAEIYVNSLRGLFRAVARGKDYRSALDSATRKIEKQMEKEKSKVKHHKKFERTRTARLEKLKESA